MDVGRPVSSISAPIARFGGFVVAVSVLRLIEVHTGSFAKEAEMRILVISDVHANWPALEAVIAAEAYDHLLVGGDLVSYGPHPREVVEFVGNHATVAVRGNHDEALAHSVDCRCAPASKPLAEATRAVHRELLSARELQYLGSLPLTGTLRDDGQTFFSVHASPREHLYRYTLTPDAPEQHLRTEIAGVEEDFILLGHTHFPMIRRLGRQIVINPGSVGQPRDGNPLASYAVIEDGVPELRRAAYDVERTVRDLRSLPVPVAITDSLVSTLRNGTA
ncbi:MAG: hypothetical protein C5B48_12410 [Candidatus Rokuibacteriota bacterium]|nr:MAG: hypothetical protein C5B48_12410 [Candidatus Rokubacteria bacterium]